MARKDLPAAHTIGSIRLALIAEVGGYLGLLWLYLNVAVHNDAVPLAVHVVAYVFLAVVPIALNLLHGDRLADSGLRVDNLWRSAKEVLPVTGVILAVVLIVGWYSDGFHWKSWSHVMGRVGRYAAWGPAQQYILQSFTMVRLRQARVPRSAAIVVGAVLFGLMHFPNWPLMCITAAAGAIWCLLFLRVPNLLTLAASHAAVAVLLYYCWPVEWLGNLRVGGGICGS